MMTSILGAAVVGALLALSGAVLQSVFRNPLAEPYILGMVGGAALFASAAAMCGLTALGCFVLPAVSFPIHVLQGIQLFHFQQLLT